MLALIVIAVAAFALKFASRYLPERGLNQLADQYGEYVRRSSRQNIQWFPFGTAAFDMAREHDKVVVMDIGTTVSLAAKAFSEDYATDAEYRRLLHDHFVAVKVDALELPWFVDALSLESDHFAATGRFELIAMNADGAVLAATQLLPQSGDNSLAMWLEDIARLRYSNRSELKRRAEASLQRRKSNAVAQLSHGPADVDIVRAWAVPWEQATLSGEFSRAQLPVSTLVADFLLDSTNGEVWGRGLSLMLGLLESPSFDCVSGGFFVMAGQAGWKQPITSKLSGHSLQLAASYAEASQRFDLPLFRWAAFKTAKWAIGARVAGLFAAGDSTDQVGMSSRHYAFSTQDVVGTPFELDADGLPSLVGKVSFAQSVSQEAASAAGNASEALQKIRNTRPSTRLDTGTYANLNGQAISGLFRIGKALNDGEIVRAAADAYAAATETFGQPLGDIEHAPAGVGRRVGYAADFAWMTRAGLDGYMATSDEKMLRTAEQTADRMLELFRGDSGALASYLPSLLEEIGFGFPVYLSTDTELPSTNAIASMCLSDLAALTGNAKYRNAAVEIIRAFSGAFTSRPAPLGLLQAARRLYAPMLLISGKQEAVPNWPRSAPAPTGRFSRPGLYLATSQRTEGPLTASEVRDRLSIR